MPDDREARGRFLVAVEEAALRAHDMADILVLRRMTQGLEGPLQQAAAMLGDSLGAAVGVALDLELETVHGLAPAPGDTFAPWARTAYSIVREIRDRDLTRPCSFPDESAALDRAAAMMRAALDEASAEDAREGIKARCHALARSGLSWPEVVRAIQEEGLGEISLIHDPADCVCLAGGA